MYFGRHFWGRWFCLIILLCVYVLVANAEESLFEKKVVNREDEKVYVISNIAPSEIMSLVCRHVLVRRSGHCQYVPLESWGTHGKRHTDILPYNWRKESETVVVIDRSRLDGVGRALLEKLIAEIFPTLYVDHSKPQTVIYLQKSGKREWQVLIDVPETTWLKQAVDDVWAIPLSRESEAVILQTYPILSVALLTNDDAAGSQLLSYFKYGRKQSFGLDEYQKFRDADGLTHKIIALNWNGSEQCTSAIANEVLPAEMRDNCDESSKDRVGLSRWQRFCREAAAESFKDGESDVWVFRAPTSKFLQSLVNRAIQTDFQEWPYRLDICDLTHIGSVAVGTYVTNPDLDRRRLILQQEMETVVQQTLQTKVKSMYSTQNWGDLIQQVLGESAVESPFKDPGGAQRVVQASNADALLVLWVRDASPMIEHSCSKTRLTPEIPPFQEAEPSKPSPNERKYGLFGPKEYPEGENSPEYQQALARYREKHSEWEQKKEAWEEKRRSHRVNWEFTIYSTPKVSVLGYLKVIDLKTKTQVWTCEVSVSSTGDPQKLKSISVQTIGDDTEPEAPELPANEYEWKSNAYTVGQDAFLSALKQGVAKLAESALWQNDLKPWNMSRH